MTNAKSNSVANPGPLLSFGRGQQAARRNDNKTGDLALKRLTLSEFLAATQHLNLTSRSLTRARRVLVDGQSVAEVAKDEGISGEAIRKICRRVAGSSRVKPPILSKAAFDQAVGGLRLRADTVERVRAVLVDGLPVGDVARAAGVDHSVVFRAVQRVITRAIPAGWRQVCAVLPEEEARQVEAMEQEALKRRDRRAD